MGSNLSYKRKPIFDDEGNRVFWLRRKDLLRLREEQRRSSNTLKTWNINEEQPNQSTKIESAKEIIGRMDLKKKNPAPHKRAYWVGLTAKMLERSFGQIFGVTRYWTVDEIRDMFLECNKKDNPPRLWWGLRKKKLKKFSTPI